MKPSAFLSTTVAFLTGSAISAATPTLAQSLAPFPQVDWAGIQRQLDAHVGEMSAVLPGDAHEERADEEMEEALRFEPLQMLDDLFLDDIVLIVRTGSRTTEPGSELRDSSGCALEDRLTEDGAHPIEDFGMLLGVSVFCSRRQKCLVIAVKRRLECDQCRI